MLTSEVCSTLLSYEPLTGEFRWLKTRGSTAKAGSIAGATDSKGYRQIRVNGRLYMAHRLAWLLTYGAWPSKALDHIDRNPLNNAIANLRECSMSENQQNVGLRRDNTSGVTGVAWLKPAGMWLAYISVNGKMIRIGRFAHFADAVAARKKAKNELHAFGAQQGVEFGETLEPA